MFMKIKWKFFYKSFLLAFLTFAIISSIIITNLYLDANAVDPLHKESTVLLGITENDKLISLCVININPQNNSFSFLPIPENVWIENGQVLQNQYNKKDISEFNTSIRNLIGTKINRYIFITTNDLNEIFSNMGESPIKLTYKAFFDKYTKTPYIDNLTDILYNRAFLKSAHTDIKRKEMKSYCQLLTQYAKMNKITLELKGKYDSQPHSSTYFIPDNPHADKNIFK